MTQPAAIPQPSAELRAAARQLTSARTDILGKLEAMGMLRVVELPDYERELVIAARRHGVTWDDIAERLGRVRQNVHQRYGRDVAAALKGDA